MPDYIPRRDADCVNFISNVARQLALDPSRFGVELALVARLEALSDAFAASYQLSQQADTRTPSILLRKESDRAAAVELTRQLGRQVANRPETRDEDRQLLGLKVRRKARRTIPPPDHAPKLWVRKIEGRRITIQLADAESPTRLAKPRDVAMAGVWLFTGEGTSPTSPQEWGHPRMTSRTLMTLEVHEDVKPGTQVWLSAHWQDATGRRSPAAAPVMAHAGFGLGKLAGSLAP